MAKARKGSASRRPRLRNAGRSARRRVARRGTVNRRTKEKPARKVQRQRRTSLNQRMRRAAVGGAAAGAAAATVATLPRVRRRNIRASVPAELSAEDRAAVERVQRAFNNLEGRAQMSAIYDDIGEIESGLTQLTLELGDLRERGYIHSGGLEDRIVAFDHHWDEVEPRVEEALKEQVRRLDRDLDGVERRIDRLSEPNERRISAADNAVNGLQRKITAAENSVRALYGPVQEELRAIDRELDRIDWMLDQLEASQEIALYDSEGPVAAVEAEWEKDGEEGPDGVLILTDQRLIFEQKEEVAKKKLFGLVATDKEKIQQLLLDFPATEIESVDFSKEGGFLGMGKDDILELTCSGKAPHSRLRFHLQGQSSEEWAKLFNKVRSGDIDGDRADEYVDELEEAQKMQARFPSQCPNCFANLASPPRGAMTTVCEFCGGTVNAEIA